MGKITKERVLEVVGYYLINGKKATLEAYNFEREDTLRRYIDTAKKEYGFKDITTQQTIQKIINEYSPKELLAISKGGRVLPGGKTKTPIVNFDGDKICIGVLSDTHLGSAYTDNDLVLQAFEEFAKVNVDMVVHSGDVTEGMSNRAGHVYELSHIGYSAQKENAIGVLKQWDLTPMYVVSGNHDLWFKKSNGADIVNDICDVCPNIIYLGEHEGDINLAGKGTLKLWHGGDGNSYAISYRLQKIVESITGGEKPNVLIAGHTHKSMYLYDRHVHVYSAGSIQKQTPWMRGKRIASHTGFWIIDVWMNNNGVSKTRGQWFPIYL